MRIERITEDGGGSEYPDVRCHRCGSDDELVVYSIPKQPLLAVCAECDKKES